MYLKINGALLDVLGEDARLNMEKELGILALPQYQFKNSSVTLAIVTDEEKVQRILNNPNITVLNTAAEFNAEIDVNYEEKYTLYDSTELQLDLNLSGNPQIPGYVAGKPIGSQENLKALYAAGMGGIKLYEKPPYVE